MSRPTFNRKYFQIAAASLAAIALIRLAFLLIHGGSESKHTAKILTHHVVTKIAVQIEGSKGETIRLHFPEVPLNLDTDYGHGTVEFDLDLKMANKPSIVRCQVLREGLVVAQSKALNLSDQASQDLGVVLVRKPK